MTRWLPIILSCAALTVASIAVVRLEPASSAACECKADVTRADYDQLAQQVRVLGSLLARRESQSSIAVASSSPPPFATDDSTTTPVTAAPKYVRFEAPRGIAVESSDNGAISVRNDDPALAGKTLVIKGEREDGTSGSVTIVVPPAAP